MRPSLLLIPVAGLAALAALPSKANLDSRGDAAHPKPAAPAGVVTGAITPAPSKAVTEMILAAKNFLASLDSEQKSAAVFQLNDDERKNWHFVPMDRKGITLQALRPEQDHLAYAMLNTVLSNEGFAKTLTIMSQEKILFDMEKGSPVRNPEKILPRHLRRAQRDRCVGLALGGPPHLLQCDHRGRQSGEHDPVLHGHEPGRGEGGPAQGAPRAG